MSNYSDDIRSFDHDSRSPFYDDGDRDEAIEQRAEEIGEQLREQHHVKINGDSHPYHIDNFIAEDVFNTGPVCAMLSGNAESLQDELIEKFNEWCIELATKDIDNLSK